MGFVGRWTTTYNALCLTVIFKKQNVNFFLKSQLLKCSFIWFEKSLSYTSIHLVAHTNEDHMGYVERPRNPQGSNFNINCKKIALEKSWE